MLLLLLRPAAVVLPTRITQVDLALMKRVAVPSLRVRRLQAGLRARKLTFTLD